MDKLLVAANSFLNMADYCYVIKLGRKNKITTLNISFDITEFHHLSGLHHLQQDMPNLKRKRNVVFNEILNGRISIEKIRKSSFFDANTEERVELSGKIMEVLDDDNTVFKYSCRKNPHSSIDAKFLVVNNQRKSGDRCILLFLDEREKTASDIHNVYCKSIFYENKMDYTIGQAKMAVLYKERINKATGERLVLVDKLPGTDE